MLFFILFLSFCLRVIRKGLRKNSEIFVNLRRSSGQSMRERLTADQNFWCSRVFLAVLRVFRGIMGCSGVLWDVPEVFRVLQTPIICHHQVHELKRKTKFSRRA